MLTDTHSRVNTNTKGITNNNAITHKARNILENTYEYTHPHNIITSCFVPGDRGKTTSLLCFIIKTGREG